MLPAIIVIAAVVVCSAYANLSFVVSDGWYFRFFPPFIPYHNLNMNNHLGAEYLNVAQAMVDGKGFANPFHDETGPTAWMPPMLPAILAALLWLFQGDRTAVMIVVIVLQLAVLMGTGLLVLALVRQTTHRLGPAVAAAIFVVGLLLDFFLCFQFTHDVWLVLLAVDLMIASLCWGRPLERSWKAAAWGAFGGFCALVNPVVAFTWGILSLVTALRHRAWLKLGVAGLVAALMVAPWTLRNYLIFGTLIPVKSNAGYELYQSQCLVPDGLVQVKTFIVHPYTADNPERQDYRDRGEIDYVRHKQERFRESVSADPLGFAERVFNRFVAVTLWYMPFEREELVRIPGWVWMRRLAYPLPFLALIFLVISARREPLHAIQWTVIGIYAIYFIPYVGISYYDRYAVPLVGAKVLLVIWAADRLLAWRAAGRKTRQTESRISQYRVVLPSASHGAANGTHARHRAGPAAAELRSPGLSVVIPVYNERQTLPEVLRRVRAVPLAKEIIVVDDGSTDGTRDLLQSMHGQPDLRILYHPRNRGKGAALKTGFLQAAGEIVIVQDADLEYDPADYDRLIRPILEDQADVVFGSRFSSGSGAATCNWHTLGNRVLTRLSNLFTHLDLTDMETGYKVFRRETLRAIAPGLKQDRFGIEPELTAKVARHGCRICEVPISYHRRTYQEGKKIGWRDGLQALWCFLRYWRWD
jgi:hypothetical protein